MYELKKIHGCYIQLSDVCRICCVQAVHWVLGLVTKLTAQIINFTIRMRLLLVHLDTRSRHSRVYTMKFQKYIIDGRIW